MYWNIEQISAFSTWVFGFVILALFAFLFFFVLLKFKRHWLLCRLPLSFLLAAILFAVMLQLRTLQDVPENIIAIGVRDGEPTGHIRKEGEDMGWLVNKDYVTMEIERKISVILEGYFSDSHLIIEAVIRVEDPNKVFQAWRDSDCRPYSADAADGNIIRLIEAKYQEATFGFEPRNPENALDQERISQANEDIKAELEKDGLVIEMEVKLSIEIYSLGESGRCSYCRK